MVPSEKDSEDIYSAAESLLFTSSMEPSESSKIQLKLISPILLTNNYVKKLWVDRWHCATCILDEGESMDLSVLGASGKVAGISFGNDSELPTPYSLTIVCPPLGEIYNSEEIEASASIVYAPQPGQTIETQIPRINQPPMKVLLSSELESCGRLILTLNAPMVIHNETGFKMEIRVRQPK